MKIDPDLPDAEIDAIAGLAIELGLEGIIATNTTVSPGPLAVTGRAGGRSPARGCVGRAAQGAFAGGAAAAARPGG